MKRKVFTIFILIITLISGMVIGRVTSPTKERIVEKEVEKEVEKIVEVESKSTGLAKEYLLKYIDAMEKVNALPRHEDQYLTTPGMKDIAGQEYKLWDDFLNDIYQKLKETLKPEDMDKLTTEQVQWIKDRDVKAENDGNKYEGGSMEGLIVITSKSGTTKQRCLELIKTYMK